MAKKYDIRVCDIDANGQKKWHEEHGIMASSTQELINIYNMCGQEIQILHEYQDEESKNYGHQKLLNPDKVNMSTGYGATGLMKVSLEDQKKVDELVSKQTQEVPKEQTLINQIPQQIKQVEQKIVVKEPPKYFNIGGIKCKMENGKFYQKQWMRLSDEEMSEIRIVSDKSNKICPIKDKHIEVLKWVLTEDAEKDAENTTTTEEKKLELLND